MAQVIEFIKILLRVSLLIFKVQNQATQKDISKNK